MLSLIPDPCLPVTSGRLLELPGFYPLLLWLHDTTSQLDFLPQCFIASDNSVRLTHFSLPCSPCKLISTLFFFFPFSVICDFYSTDKPFSTAVLVEHHMVKTGIFFLKNFPPPTFKNILLNMRLVLKIQKEKNLNSQNCIL